MENLSTSKDHKTQLLFKLEADIIRCKADLRENWQFILTQRQMEQDVKLGDLPCVRWKYYEDSFELLFDETMDRLNALHANYYNNTLI